MVSVSLGAPRDFVLRHKQSGQEHKVVLRNGDACVFTDQVNKEYTHSIPKALTGAKPRISIVFWCNTPEADCD